MTRLKISKREASSQFNNNRTPVRITKANSAKLYQKLRFFGSDERGIM